MEGTYTSKKRVERDGYLVAFEGERMTMDEAVRRGLVKPKAAKEPERKSEKELEQKPEGE